MLKLDLRRRISEEPPKDGILRVFRALNAMIHGDLEELQREPKFSEHVFNFFDEPGFRDHAGKLRKVLNAPQLLRGYQDFYEHFKGTGQILLPENKVDTLCGRSESETWEVLWMISSFAKQKIESIGLKQLLEMIPSKLELIRRIEFEKIEFLGSETIVRASIEELQQIHRTTIFELQHPSPQKKD